MKLDLSGPWPALDLSDESLTPAQREALRFDREVVVTAGAGAGKTHTLSLRYVALLLDLAVEAVRTSPAQPRPEIEAVLVLTFTEKAAEEMKARCAIRLTELSAAAHGAREALDARHGPGFGRGLAAAVDHLAEAVDRARITTFHGFCAGLLREHPAETGVAPGFEILDEVDAQRVRGAAVDAAIEALLAERPEDVPPLWASFGTRARVAEAVSRLLDQRGVLMETLEDHAAGRVTLQGWIDAARPSGAEVRRWLAEEGSPWLLAVRGALEPHGPVAVRERLAELERACHAQGDLDAFGAYRDLLGWALREGRPRALTHFTVLGRRADWPTDYAEAKAALAALAGEVVGWAPLVEPAAALPGPADGALVDLLQRLAVLVLDAHARLQQAFAAEGAVDFSELQVRAVRAVTGSPALAAALRRRFRRVMVDEFQDTDLPQWALVSAIGRPEDAARDRVFVVGDAKQSIYGFRGGDVTVFRGAARALGEAETPDARGTSVRLAENFRSREGLVDWFNAAFDVILGPPSAARPAWEAPGEPMIPASGRGGGAVEWLRVPGGDRAAEVAARQAGAVAALVAGELLAADGPAAELRLHDTSAHPRPPIALLLRARTHLGAYEAALRRMRVPFVVARGVGFWARPEVVDLVNLLHAVAAADPISAVGALRSPLLGVPDDVLAAWLVAEPDGAARLVTGAGDGARRGALPAALASAARTLAELRALRDRLPVSAWLREAIARTGAEHAWALDDPWGQARANAARLVEIAARFDGRGADGLTEVAAAFLERVESEAPEAEAAVAASEARVVVMTVHASKGLEFPVVIVPGLDATPRGAAGPVTVARLEGVGRYEFAARVRDPAPVAARPGRRPVRGLARPGRLEALDQQRRREEAAESKRLLYVAATRARDRLVFVSPEGPGRAGTWMELLEQAAAAPGGAPIPRAATELAGVAPLPPRAPEVPEVPADLADRVGPLPRRPEVELTPSSLVALRECPLRWRLGSVEGVPEGPAGPRSRALGLAALRGRALHEALEDGEAHDPARVRARFVAIGAASGLLSSASGLGGPASGLGAPELELEAERVVAHAARVTADPALAAMLAAPGLVEQRFEIPHGGAVVRGQIDRLWWDREAREWVVVDWKSERVEGPAEVQRAVARHADQLLAYVWGADRTLAPLGHPPVRRAAIAFSELGGLVELPRVVEPDLRRFEQTVVEAVEWARRPLAEVSAAVLTGPTPRPCDRCGHRGRACVGRLRGPASAAE